MKKITWVVFLTTIALNSFASTDLVTKIYHENKARWGQHKGAEVGCALEGSDAFYTFSFSKHAKQIEITYWMRDDEKVAGRTKEPPNYIAAENSHFYEDDFSKGVISLNGSKLALYRTIEIDGKWDSTFELSVDLTSDDPRNYIHSITRPQEQRRPQEITGRLLCRLSDTKKKSSVKFKIPQPKVRVIDAKIIEKKFEKNEVPQK